MSTMTTDLGLKFNALSSEFRRLLLGLIYTDGPIYQSEILRHVGVESNKLAYHLNMLCNANLVGREYERHGKHIARYSIREDGIRFLKNIGAIDKLRRLSRQKSVTTKYRQTVKPPTKYQGQYTQKSLGKRKVLMA